MNEHSILRQDVESFDSLVLVRLGKATQGASHFAGGINFIFEDSLGRDDFVFDWISSVMYYDELLSTKMNFPYCSAANWASGLYECLGSSYLKRIASDDFSSGQTFSGHRHFIYWDSDFNWNITCGGLLKNGIAYK
jgi:hypothetical protein